MVEKHVFSANSKYHLNIVTDLIAHGTGPKFSPQKCITSSDFGNDGHHFIETNKNANELTDNLFYEKSAKPEAAK